MGMGKRPWLRSIGLTRFSKPSRGPLVWRRAFLSQPMSPGDRSADLLLGTARQRSDPILNRAIPETGLPVLARLLASLAFLSWTVFVAQLFVDLGRHSQLTPVAELQRTRCRQRSVRRERIGSIALKFGS